MTSALAPLTVPGIGSGSGQGVTHGFFGRAGGLSTGLYRGLNCGFGSGDDKENVATNRARVAAAMGLTPENLLTVYQTHSPHVIVVSQPHRYEDAPKADAMVTATPDLGLAILTADCAPVLFADEKAGVIGAAHAGWKGACAGVLENTVQAMEALGATRANISAAIGPTISQTNYEVGPEFTARFLGEDAANARFFAPSSNADHSLFDLPAYCSHRLQAAGIETCFDVARCTYADEVGYFSYRRATHNGEPDYGRNISVIALAP